MVVAQLCSASTAWLQPTLAGRGKRQWLGKAAAEVEVARWEPMGAREYYDYRKAIYGDITHKAILVDATGTLIAPIEPMAQGLLKVLAGIDTSFTVTSKATDEEGDFAELYMFKWTTLLIPPTTILIINLVSVVVGISYAINSGYQSWGPLFGKLFFAFWVIVHYMQRTT